MMRFVRVILLLVLCGAMSGCVVIDDGEEGVSKRFGKIADGGLTAGLHWQIPVIRDIEVFNIKTQRRTLNLEIPSGEGLMVKLQATLLFRPVDVVAVRKTIGPEEVYVDKVVDPTVINTFREIIQKQRVEDIIRNQEKLTKDSYALLTKALVGRGITVEDLLVTGLALPPKFREAVERKLESEQKALQKEFELKQAKKDAEIEVARARGAAEAQQIVRSTLSSEYLSYLWIKTLNQNPNVIYVATEANMPVFRTTNEQSAPPIKK